MLTARSLIPRSFCAQHKTLFMIKGLNHLDVYCFPSNQSLWSKKIGVSRIILKLLIEFIFFLVLEVFYHCEIVTHPRVHYHFDNHHRKVEILCTSEIK